MTSVPSPPRPPSVVAVVLDWNGLEDTLRCVESLRHTTHRPLTILVVDNGSRVSPRERLQAAGAAVELIENPRNLGYAGGNNVGIRVALERDADFVWILNNDALVEPETLSRLLETAIRHPSAAAVGGKVLRTDRPATIWVAWGRVTWLQSLIALVGEDAPDDGRFDGEHVVPWIPGCSILLRSAALRSIGAFDEEFFAYHEDVEWAARAHAAGWQLWYNGAARTFHAVHGSSGGAGHYGGFRKYLSARNSVLYAKRHGRLWQKALMAIAILLTVPLQFVRRWISGEHPGVVLKLRGWLDGLRGRPIPLRELGLE
jgi:GT2 family glycosyltransferase